MVKQSILALRPNGVSSMHRIVAMVTTTVALLTGFYTDAQPISPSIKRIVFIGNSITYVGGYVNNVEAYLLAGDHNFSAEIINVGVPSETVSGLSEPNHADGKFPRPDLHERLDRVLAALKPDLVFADYGMNDGIYLPLDALRFQKFKDGIEWMHNKVVSSGARIIHLTPPVFDEKRANAPGYENVLKEYSAWLMKQRAEKNGK